MLTPEQLLRDNHIQIGSYRPGRHYATCPRCSAQRQRAHQKLKCLGVTIDGKGVSFGCNHCGWTGGASYNNGNGQQKSDFAAIYPYVDENGDLLFEVCRTWDKEFPQRKPNGHGDYAWSTKGVRKVLFRLPELVEAISNEHIIVVTEGEKDVLNLARIGIVATCNPGGAAKPGQKPKWHRDYSEALRGADIVILPDHDAPGYAHAEAIARMSAGLAKRIRILKLADYWRDCPEGGDVSDWLKVGHTREELDDLIVRAPDYAAQDAKPEPQQAPPDSALAWHWQGEADPIDTRRYLVEGLLPETGTALISGQWGTYKTFVADDLAACVMTGSNFINKFPILRKGGVLWVAREGWNEVPIRITAAWEAKGGSGRAPFAWIENCPRLLDPNAAPALAALIAPAAERMRQDFSVPVVLVIIDTLGKAAGLSKDGQLNDDTTAKLIMDNLARASAASGALFAGIAHFGKNKETGTKGSTGFEDDADVVLALLGERGIGGRVDKPMLCVRKRRFGANGEEFSFRTCLTEVVSEQTGKTDTTLTLQWVEDAVAPVKKPERDPWATSSLPLLRQCLTNMLTDCGSNQRPYADGPVVWAVDLEVVRGEFYKSYPASGADKAQARRKAFIRAVKDASAKKLITCREIGATTFAWVTGA